MQSRLYHNYYKMLTFEHDETLRAVYAMADNARKGGRFCSKNSEIGRTIQTLWRAIPGILFHFFIHIPNMHETHQKKYRILPIFLPALSAKA